jgi:peptidylprolyl isomerase
VATSRRRERELARRRFERRRQAEIERRARAKRRNTIIGASAGTAAVIAGIVVLVITLSGGSGKSKPSANHKPTPTPTSTATTNPAANQSAPKKCKPISPNPPAKGQPKIPDVKGKNPKQLVVKDIKVGHGPAAKKGSSVGVTYIGVGCSTGTVFDATYLHGGKPFTVSPLGSAGVIPGWNKGLIGMRQGGVRELIIPGPLAYESNPSLAPTFPKDTLIFLVTAKSVKA